MMNAKKALLLHERLKGKLTVSPKITVTPALLPLLYTPGVAEVARHIYRQKKDAYRYTGKGNSIAILSDGSRILGLGNLGAEAALPVMESKALLYKAYGNVDAVPLCVKTQDPQEIIDLAENIAPNFGALTIEDIQSPECFYVVEKLEKRLNIPVFHDDQHGTAIVAVAALWNALKVVKKKLSEVKIVIAGAGAAGYGIAHLLFAAGARHLTITDSEGIIHRGRKHLSSHKQQLVRLTKSKQRGTLRDALRRADVFIGVSGQARLIDASALRRMNSRPIVFALSNPDPEIMPTEAYRGGAAIVATGRSDFPNQVNNVLAFPGVMRGLLDVRAKKMTKHMSLRAAHALASFVKKPAQRKILPSIFDKRVASAVARAIR